MIKKRKPRSFWVPIPQVSTSKSHQSQVFQNSKMDFMDQETALLILQLQFEDSNELSGQLEGKGKGREEELSDLQVALQLYGEELERNSCFLADHQMASSMARACRTDSLILTSSLSQEQTAASDREVACRLSGDVAPNAVPPWTVSSAFLDDDLMSKLTALYHIPCSDSLGSSECDPFFTSLGMEYEDPESSSWAASREPSKWESRECAACQEHVPFYDTARVPCGHDYCRDCLRELFLASMSDESLFPPRCCQQTIATGGVRIFLTSELAKQYEAKKIEYATPNRIYCSNTFCSAFIPQENIQGELAICLQCISSTCTICKAVAHSGDCPEDTGLHLALLAANENGWQRCYRCRRLVELEYGCNHMTCPCGAQFCYICGDRWKTCECEQWTEDRLTRRQHILAQHPPLAEHLPQQQQQQEEITAAQNLRDRQDCDHETWQFISGRHDCDSCSHTLPSYIFECTQCNIQACNHCRLNRL